jgi:hypothetical protein
VGIAEEYLPESGAAVINVEQGKVWQNINRKEGLSPHPRGLKPVFTA